MKLQESCSELLHQLIQKKIKNKSKKYCGPKENLPPNYESFGHRYECLKKGVGVGKYQVNDTIHQIIDDIILEATFFD